MSWWVTIVVNAVHNVSQLFEKKEDRNYKTITSNGSPDDLTGKYKNLAAGVPPDMYIGIDNIGYKLAPVKQTLFQLQKKNTEFVTQVDFGKYIKSGKDDQGNDLYILKLEYRVQPKFPEDLIKLKSYYPMSIGQNIMPYVEPLIYGVDELEGVTVTANRIPKNPNNPKDNGFFTIVLICIGVAVLGVNYYRSNK